MKKSELSEGQVFYGVLAELVRDHDGNRKRVITISGQAVPSGLYIECSTSVRERNSLGTIFKVDVRVTSKPDCSIHLHSLKKQELLTVNEWNAREAKRSA